MNIGDRVIRKSDISKHQDMSFPCCISDAFTKVVKAGIVAGIVNNTAEVLFEGANCVEKIPTSDIEPLVYCFRIQFGINLPEGAHAQDNSKMKEYEKVTKNLRSILPRIKEKYHLDFADVMSFGQGCIIGKVAQSEIDSVNTAHRIMKEIREVAPVYGQAFIDCLQMPRAIVINV